MKPGSYLVKGCFSATLFFKMISSGFTPRERMTPFHGMGIWQFRQGLKDRNILAPGEAR